MRNYCRILLLSLTLHSVSTFAIEFGEPADDVYDDGFFPGYLCDECRDPDEFPMDFAAFAFNGFFGDNPWLRDTELGIPFRVYALDGQWVVIWFDNVLFDIQTMLPNLLDILLRLNTGQILTFTVVQNGPDLLLGDPEGGSGEGSGCSCAGGTGDDSGDDEYDEYDEPDEYELEEPERYGVVEIEDPDENGEFSDWQQEL